jgi:Toprim domain
MTKLTADGRKYPGEPVKIMLGSAPGVPIVLAPVNDLLGLVITEGIEDGLSVVAATGCGVWVAGCATRMPRLAAAIPSWVECVTICADDDEAGRSNAHALAELLYQRGGVEIKLEGVT